MRIATLQFAPKLGDVQGNINKANELLKKGKSISLGDQTPSVGIGLDLLRPDVLVLPELALTGMYFAQHVLKITFNVETCTHIKSIHLIIFRLQLPLIGGNQATSRASRVRAECCVGTRNSQTPAMQGLRGLP